MKTLKFFIYFILISILLVASFIVYSLKPYVSNNVFVDQSIINKRRFEYVGSIDHLRLATYNIGYASGKKNNQPEKLEYDEVIANLDSIVDTLKQIHADIIGLQEVDFHSYRTHHINEMDYIADALNMPYRAYVVTWNKSYVPWPYWPIEAHFRGVVSGQVILSRYPILIQETLLFPKPKSNPFWYNAYYLNRVLQKVTLQIDERKVVVWNVHLEAFDKKTRHEQMTTLARQVQQTPSEVAFIVGDFNSSSAHLEGKSKVVKENSPALTELSKKTGFINAEGSSSFLSFPSWKPKEKIDHIFYRSTVPLNDNEINIKSTASDHLPVWADFSFK